MEADEEPHLEVRCAAKQWLAQLESPISVLVRQTKGQWGEEKAEGTECQARVEG